MGNKKTVSVTLEGAVAERFDALRTKFYETFKAKDENEIALVLLIMGLVTLGDTMDEKEGSGA